MATYNISRKHIIPLLAVFGAGAIIEVLLVFQKPLFGVFLIVSSIICLLAFTIVESTIVTTGTYLLKAFRTNSLYSRCYWSNRIAEHVKKIIIRKDELCKWEWIYSITTKKDNTLGGYFTLIHWTRYDRSKLEEYLSKSNKCNENIGNILIESRIDGYKQLLKEIIERCHNAIVDENTANLLK